MARAAKAAGVQHVIWSTLEDVRDWVPLSDDRMPTLNDKYKVPHFDGKGESNHYFTDEGLPVTFLNTSFYWDNMIYFGMGPKRGEDGVLAITFPLGGAKLAGIAGGDIGAVAYGIFADSATIGTTIGIAGGHLTGQDMADGLTKALGEKVNYNAVSPAVYRSFGFPGAEDLGNMFQFNAEFSDEYCAARSLEVTRRFDPDLHTFDQWLEENVARIPLD
jgi:hypothetical protein